jgi:UDP-glucose 4-epimerase
MRLLVTGGAGFVGSHVVLAALDRGDEVVVLDNLSTGHRAAVPQGADFVLAELADRRAVADVFRSWRFDAVIHMAALSLVGESMRDPLRYCRENANNALILAEEALRAGCHRFVLSSTAALFGAPERQPIDEEAAIAPASAYGESKAMIERALAWAAQTQHLSFCALRYFNAAGADPAGRAGEDHAPETHLIPLAIDAALGRREPLTVFGEDWPTRDGTPIRDYIHVSDLASAHLAVLPRMQGGVLRYNLGNGRGTTVREVMAAVERAAGVAVPHRVGPRRAGDPAVLVASSERLMRETGWAPKLGAIEEIVQSALAWRRANPRGYR